MTTPAVSINETFSTSGTSFSKYLNYPVDTYPWSGYYLSRFRSRPESVSNPVRADGTRAPSNWAHRWAVRSSNVISFDHVLSNMVREWGSRRGYYLQSSAADSGGCVASAWMNSGSSSGFPLSVDNRAKTKVLKKMLAAPQKRSGISGANFGESLAELRETAGLVTGVATSLVRTTGGLGKILGPNSPEIGDFLRRFENKTREEAIDIARTIAGRRGADIIGYWLGYQFGVKPLVGDIDASSRLLSDLVNRDGTDGGFKFTVRAGDEEIESGWEEILTDIPSVKAHMHYSLVSKAHYSLTVGCPNPRAALYESLGLSNPYSTAWNVMRFSWLCDYLLDVGSWLESMTPALNQYRNFQLLEGTKTWYQYSATDDTKWSKGTGQPSSLPSGVAGFIGGGRLVREVLSSFPIPAVFPSFRKSVNVSQMANALSALTVLVGKRKQ